VFSTAYETRRTEWDEVLLDHGVVTTNVREGIRRAALKQVVVPCLLAMVEENARRTGPEGTVCESIAIG